MKALVKFVLPSLDLLINSFLLFKIIKLAASYLEFEYLIAAMYFLFFVLVSVNTIFKNAIPFMHQQRTFNLLFIAQFLASILIFQLLGWIFTIYLAFILMLSYLYFTKQHGFFTAFLHLCGVTIGGIFLYTVFL